MSSHEPGLERVLAGLVRKYDDLERRLRHLEALDLATVSSEWAPTITQNVTVAWDSNASHATYTMLGKLAHVHADLTFSGAGTSGYVVYIGGLPYSAAHPAAAAIGAWVLVNDAAGAAGGPYFYTGTLALRWDDAGYLLCYTAREDAYTPPEKGGYLGANPDLSLRSGDTLSFDGWYEMV